MTRSEDFPDWDEFVKYINEIRPPKDCHGNIRPLLFRGHSNCDWKLETTLERTNSAPMSVIGYYRYAEAARLKIESFKECHWQVQPIDEVEKGLRDPVMVNNQFLIHLGAAGTIPNYEYLVYLRHHGFPSPLMDWTRSIYIAAFFAFRNARNKPASIVVLNESPDGLKLRASYGSIYRLDENVRAHRRHLLQQSNYTISIRLNGESEWEFFSHEDSMSSLEDAMQNGVPQRQDEILKANFDPRVATKMMGILDEMNINAYSLFASDEALMETLAARLSKAK
ncbi:MAG: FRG domain-containing protein [Rhodospirillales bacterium]